MMKTETGFIVLLAVGLAAAAAYIVGRPAEPLGIPSSASSQAADTAALEQRISKLSDRVDALAGRLDEQRSVESARWQQVVELLQAGESHAAQPAQTSAPNATSPSTKTDETFEQLRDRWRAHLAGLKQRIVAEDPAGENSRNVTTYTYLEILRNAGAALEQARDMEGLQKLSEGQFKTYFRLKP